MMKCLIFSDSHGNEENIREAMRMHRDAEAIFFLGDGLRDIDSVASDYPDKIFVTVRGNCDVYPYFRGMDVEKCVTLSLGGRRITATHGDLYGVKYGLGMLHKLASDTGSDIILFGHTHEKREECFIKGEKSVSLFNPGSIGSGSFGILILGDAPSFSYGIVERY